MLDKTAPTHRYTLSVIRYPLTVMLERKCNFSILCTKRIRVVESLCLDLKPIIKIARISIAKIECDLELVVWPILFSSV